MGQSLEFIFLADEKVEQDGLKARLAEIGLTRIKWDGYLKGGGYGGMTWARSSGNVELHGAVYHGSWNKHFVRMGLDSALLRRLVTLADRKCLVDDLLVLGTQLWEAFRFYEGALSPEEEGRFLYTLRQAPVEEIQRDLPANSYATLLSSEASALAQIRRWVPKTHPHATIKSLERDSLLVIWDASNEGLVRFLSEEFSID